MKNRNNIVIGAVFIVLGLVFLLGALNIFSIRFDIFDFGFLVAHFWPAAALILPGFIMHMTFFSGKNRDAGILVPGGILLVVGITCQISMLFDVWGEMWPGYILAVAVGLFELYLFGNRDKGLLIPVAILGIISLIFFDQFTFRWLFGFRLKSLMVAVVLILLGFLIIFRNRLPGNEGSGTNRNAGNNQAPRTEENPRDNEGQNL